jgi:hypothetical protein
MYHWSRKVFAAVCACLAACAQLPRLDAVPPALESQASIELEGVSGAIRYRVGRNEQELADEFVRSWDRERADLAAQGNLDPLPPTAFLAISGGGDKGAFAAGILNGWSAAGNRPQFKLVTGISTGALIAPFAFLGPQYDSYLKQFYTTTTSEDILKARSLIKGWSSDALADSEPLRQLIRKHVNRELLDAIAAEYRKGRELWICTTNLDSLHRYIWNMTRIATSPDPAAVELFVSLMMASAAIPGEFPPVLVDVVADGRRFQEMHVDGGAMSQVFVYPIGLDFEGVYTRFGASRRRSLYVIRNARIDPEWAQIERKTYRIITRSISSLVQSQGAGDIYRIYLESQRDGLDFNLAFIPASFDAPHDRQLFDVAFMRSLFDEGYRLAATGQAWQKLPPGYAPAGDFK